VVLGISFDTQEENRAFADRFQAPFQLRSDTTGEVGATYDIVPGPDERSSGCLGGSRTSSTAGAYSESLRRRGHRGPTGPGPRGYPPVDEYGGLTEPVGCHCWIVSMSWPFLNMRTTIPNSSRRDLEGVTAQATVVDL
jgi:hypothetical protein